MATSVRYAVVKGFEEATAYVAKVDPKRKSVYKLAEATQEELKYLREVIGMVDAIEIVSAVEEE
jgi:hypothetical protein